MLNNSQALWFARETIFMFKCHYSECQLNGSADIVRAVCNFAKINSHFQFNAIKTAVSKPDTQNPFAKTHWITYNYWKFGALPAIKSKIEKIKYFLNNFVESLIVIYSVLNRKPKIAPQQQIKNFYFSSQQATLINCGYFSSLTTF